jgi:hypothetical protein
LIPSVCPKSFYASRSKKIDESEFSYLQPGAQDQDGATASAMNPMPRRDIKEQGRHDELEVKR